MTQTLGDFLSGIFVGLGQESAMGDKLAAAAKGVYINNVTTLTNTLWAHTKRRCRADYEGSPPPPSAPRRC